VIGLRVEHDRPRFSEADSGRAWLINGYRRSLWGRSVRPVLRLQ
jgi:hypothetical protein